MFSSTIIPTIGRPTLTRAVQSVLEQDSDGFDFEVIVVNDSGQPLPSMPWLESPRVRVINTDHRERCVARNLGAALAQGGRLHFLDDDDFILPGALQQFWQLSGTTAAAWLYGGYRFVNSAGRLLEECHPDERGNCFIRFIVGEWLPLQASLIDSEAFFAVGGFASLNSLRGGDEDVDLARRMSLRYDIAGIRCLVAEIRVGRDTSSTDYANLREQSRVSREGVLNSTGVFARLRDSARSRPTSPDYWSGRMVSTFLVSAVWNLKEARPLIAVSRAISGLASLCLSIPHLLSRRFWRGATRMHQAKGWLSTEMLP